MNCGLHSFLQWHPEVARRGTQGALKCGRYRDPPASSAATRSPQHRAQLGLSTASHATKAAGSPATWVLHSPIIPSMHSFPAWPCKTRTGGGALCPAHLTGHLLHLCLGPPPLCCPSKADAEIFLGLQHYSPDFLSPDHMKPCQFPTCHIKYILYVSMEESSGDAVDCFT